MSLGYCQRGYIGCSVCSSDNQSVFALWHVAPGRHAIEFARWQHPAMWHVAMGSWHWIR